MFAMAASGATPTVDELPSFADHAIESDAVELVFNRTAASITEGQLDGGVTFPAYKLPATFVAPYPDRPTEFCTATLIGPSVILTAAHCLDVKGVGDIFRIRKISVRMSGGAAPIKAISCALPKAYLSSGYATTKPRNAHDYALCEMERVVPVRAEVISLDANAAKVGDKLMMAGYGCTYEPQPGGALKEVPSTSLLVGVNKRSGAKWGWLTVEGVAGTDAVSLCRGDSGGAIYAHADPLVSKGEFGWQVVAVASGVIKNPGGKLESYLSPLSAPEFATFLEEWQYPAPPAPHLLIGQRGICGREYVDQPFHCRPK
jgi:hypothetical protein